MLPKRGQAFPFFNFKDNFLHLASGAWFLFSGTATKLAIVLVQILNCTYPLSLIVCLY